MKIFKQSLLVTLFLVWLALILAYNNQERVYNNKIEQITKIVNSAPLLATTTATSIPLQGQYINNKGGKIQKTIYPTSTTKLGEFYQKIDETFSDEVATKMKAILMAESTGNLYAENHNCLYNQSGQLVTERSKGVYSTFCKSKYHSEIGTHSVDCGLLGINAIVKNCEDYMFTPEYQIKRAKEIFDTQGLTAWSSYNNKHYLAYLK